jgi:hypothetical protein
MLVGILLGKISNRPRLVRIEHRRASSVAIERKSWSHRLVVVATRGGLGVVLKTTALSHRLLLMLMLEDQPWSLMEQHQEPLLPATDETSQAPGAAPRDARRRNSESDSITPHIS